MEQQSKPQLRPLVWSPTPGVIVVQDPTRAMHRSMVLRQLAHSIACTRARRGEQ